jgi:hypothetical protein
MNEILIDIPADAYDAGAAALKPYPIAKSDWLDAASDVLHAAVPRILAVELTSLADQMMELAHSMRMEDGQGIRAAGLVEGVAMLRERVLKLRDEQDTAQDIAVTEPGLLVDCSEVVGSLPGLSGPARDIVS